MLDLAAGFVLGYNTQQKFPVKVNLRAEQIPSEGKSERKFLLTRRLTAVGGYGYALQALSENHTCHGARIQRCCF